MRRTILSLFLAVGLVATACSGDESGSPDDTTGTTVEMSSSDTSVVGTPDDPDGDGVPGEDVSAANQPDASLPPGGDPSATPAPADEQAAAFIGCATTGTCSADRNYAFVYAPGQNLAGANLAGAMLSGADLSGSDLSGADLSGADLSGSDLIGTNLSGANLSGANIAGAILTGANLTGADLSGTLYCQTLMPDGADRMDNCEELNIIISDGTNAPDPEFTQPTTGP
jgi:hypothetical protein